MLNRMIVGNLRRRPMRSTVSIVAVAIEVVLILMIVGLVNGMINDQRSRMSGIGADIVVRSSTGSMFAALSGNTLPVKLAGVLARVPGVEAVAPVAYHINTGISTVGGVDLPSFDKVSGGFRFLKGHVFEPGTHQVIVDDLEAAANHYHVGQTIPIFGQPFQLVGIFEHGMGSRIFMDLNVLDQYAGSPGKAATFYIKTAPHAKPPEVVARLRRLAPGETVDSIAQYLSLFTASGISPALPIFRRVMISIAVAIGFLVIFLSLYTTVLERTREIGILKSLGAPKRYIVGALLRESELLAILGIILGTILAYVLWRSLTHAYPTLSMQMEWPWVVYAALIALVSSAVGALYPAIKAARQDPIAALAYE